MICPAEQHLRRQVPALLAAQRASDHNRLERELVDPGRDIPAAAFALDDEQLAFLDSESHTRIIGKEKTKGYPQAGQNHRRLGSTEMHFLGIPPFGAMVGLSDFECQVTERRAVW
jgi:hypothetical protein